MSITQLTKHTGTRQTVTKFRKTSEIRLNPANPRIIRDEKYRVLVRSVAQFPKMLDKRGIVVDGTKMILGGNQRWRAILDILKMPESELTALLNGDAETFARWEILREKQAVPENWIVDGSDMTDDEIRRFIIADNVEMGEHDWDMLANQWDADDLANWGVDVPGFDVGKQDAVEDDYEMPDEIETDIVAGDLFEIGPHRLLCGDSTKADDVERLMNGERADMVFTDPPHDLDNEQHNNIMQICISYCKNDIFILSSNKALIHLALNESFSDFFVHDFVFHIGGGSGPLRQYDLIGHFNKSRFFNQNEGFSNCVRVNSMRMGGYVAEKIHDHQKSVLLLDKFIRHYSLNSELVLDIFLGAGTTMVAAHQLGRKCFGMEIDSKYCQVIVDRMLKLDPEIEINKNGQPYFVAETVL